MKSHLQRRWKLYSAVLVITAVIGGTVAVFVNRDNGDNGEAQPIPSSSSTSGTTRGDVGVEVVSSPSDGGVDIGGTSGGDFLIRLSEGQAQPQALVPLSLVDGVPLTPAEIEQVLARMPDLAGEEGSQVDFRLPEEVLPPPLTGDTLTEVFPPDITEAPPEEAVEGPLEVLRYGPEGEIAIAPFINVTFNQPMVPLATLAQLAALDIPVQITPDLPGTWRWVGAKTLTFNYDSGLIDRLPMATQYQVVIPVGTQSMTGGTLEREVSFSFTTPPPRVVNHFPYDAPQPLSPVFVLAFDQRVDPQAVLDTVKVAAGGSPVAVRLATAEELAADKAASQVAELAVEGRWLAFTVSSPLPTDTRIEVQVGPGTPSAEGPLTSTAAYTFGFNTYAPLKIVRHGCAWYEEPCPPLSPFYIEFNNPIDPDVYDPAMLTVEPAIPGVMVDIFGNTLNIRGATQGQTTYKITVSPEIQDLFGQQLGKSETLTFKVGKAEPRLIGPDMPFITIDPAAEQPVVSLYTINYTKLDLQIYAVQPSDWPAFQKYVQDYSRTDLEVTPPGRKVLDESRPIEAATDKLTEVSIEMGEFMDGDYGHFVLIAKPPKELFQEDRYWETVNVWVQVTQIGVDALVDQQQMVVWANALKDGAPLAGISLTSQSGQMVGTTGTDGTVRFDLPTDGISYLVAQQGADQALLLNSPYPWGDGRWSPYAQRDTYYWYVFNDRQMYRPGEDVHIKGWIRLVGSNKGGDVGLPGSGLQAVSYLVYDPQGNNLGSGRVEVNALGGFDFVVEIPTNANLGNAYVELRAEGSLSADGEYSSHNFQVQEFRRPEFEVTARNESIGPYFVGERATVAVEAKYFAGGALPNAPVNWVVSSSETNYEPPNWPEFTFGYWEPWWHYYSPYLANEYYVEYGGSYEYFQGTTDSTGSHYLELDFSTPEIPRPRSVLAEASVEDVNRQAWAGTTSLLVHPASLYVGIRSEKYFVERGTPLEIELIVTDIDGNAVTDQQVIVTAARLDWQYKGGQYQEVEVDPQTCTVGSQAEPVTCSFETPVGGTYQVTALVVDVQGRENQSRFTRWVSGSDLPPARRVEQETVTLIPDKESYQPGDVAQVLVMAPFSPAEGLLTVSRSGMLYSERFELDDGSTTLSIPIEDAHIPNLNIQVDLVGSAPRLDDSGNVLPGAPQRPAYASGQLNLSIPPVQRTLSLVVTPAEARLEPGGETTVAVLLTDANGSPVPNAELAVVVVDEAILALTGYRIADPISVFYVDRYTYIDARYSRASIVLVNPLSLSSESREVVVEQEVAMDSAAGGEAALAPQMEAPAAPTPGLDKSAEESGEASATTPIQVRMDFNPLAVFSPEVRTDANGAAEVAVKLPDNLTRYRIMVVAVDDTGKRFGSGESTLTARLPLMVRPSAPRFLNFGDTFELPLVLQNQTDEPLTVDVVLETTNLLLTDGQGKRVTVPANDRVEVRFPAAADMAGTARFQVAAISGLYADAAQVEIPVFTPATTEAFATYGILDDGAVAQPVARPLDVYPQFGGLEIQTSSTALQALTDALIYLATYPYECSEQYASRILGIAALRDVLEAFKADGLPSPEALEAAVNRDIAMLEGLQNSDGGFPYWRRGQESIPYNTIHVALALVKAEEKNFGVPFDMKARVLNYLQNIESYYPAWYSQETRDHVTTYALYVRSLMGDRDLVKARSLFNRVGVENLKMESVGWLWQVMMDDGGSTAELDIIRRYITNRVVETAGAANFTTAYTDQSYVLLSSDRRTDAVLLDALINDNPDSDLIPKLVNGLLAHQKRGRWNNTQENVFVLLALDRYFNTYESQSPEFVARIWLGDTYAGEHAFLDYTTERRETTIPMDYLVNAPADTQNLVISKEGVGRLYYRLGLKYAPTDLWLEPLDMGFVVQRIYEAVDDPEDVYRDAEGVWHIKAGARVRVRLTMVADNRRYHVALVDPLPAGLEIVNPALAVSGAVPQDPNSTDFKYGWWWWGTWYEHQNMRDERVEAFTTLLWEGVYEYTYIARATTPGRFVVPPAKAEEMYSPEVFGRSGSDWVVIE